MRNTLESLRNKIKQKQPQIVLKYNFAAVCIWYAWCDSNARHIASEAIALSSWATGAYQLYILYHIQQQNATVFYKNNKKLYYCVFVEPYNVKAIDNSVKIYYNNLCGLFRGTNFEVWINEEEKDQQKSQSGRLRCRLHYNDCLSCVCRQHW